MRGSSSWSHSHLGLFRGHKCTIKVECGTQGTPREADNWLPPDSCRSCTYSPLSWAWGTHCSVIACRPGPAEMGAGGHPLAGWWHLGPANAGRRREKLLPCLPLALASPPPLPIESLLQRSDRTSLVPSTQDRSQSTESGASGPRDPLRGYPQHCSSSRQHAPRRTRCSARYNPLLQQLYQEAKRTARYEGISS